MEDLIKALNIFLKYGNPEWPCHCEHDKLYICGYEDIEISEEDKKRLEEFGFFLPEDTDEGWISYKYGSC